MISILKLYYDLIFNIILNIPFVIPFQYLKPFNQKFKQLFITETSGCMSTSTQQNPPKDEPETKQEEEEQEKTEEADTNQGTTQKNEQVQTKQIEKLVQNMNLNDQKQPVEAARSGQVEKQGEIRKSSQNQMIDDTKYFVEISRNSVPFGRNVLFPGSIEELDVVIGLKDENLEDNQNNDPYMLRVIARCSNTQFDALDEYVFSVRSNDRFQYFEEVRFKIRKKERAQVKVAVKIPPVKENYTLQGVLEVQLESLQPVCLPITGKCEVPQIICIKDLYKADEECSMIKVPAKKNQIRMPPIPFKNLSPFNITLEVEAISNENFANRPYDIATQNYVNCQANMQFFVNLQLKENMNYKGVLPVRDTIRKILVLKIKNSSVFFNYPIEVNVFEGTNAGGMS